jgi:hypothetical protein
LAPLLFVIAGWAVANAGWKKMRGSRSAEDRMDDPHWATDPLQLEPQVGPAGKVFGAFVFAALWNGLVSVFVWQAIKSWQSGRPDWFLTLFIIPFVLVGIASIGAVGYFLLAVANPRPRLTLTPGRPRLGETLQLQWRFTGRSGRMSHLRIFLEGREEATYQRGTNTYTDKEVFATVDFVDTTADWEMPRGTAELVIAEDTMHSFEADSNKIVWEIKVAGDIARWPDVQQNFPITIRSMRIGGP